MTNALSKYGLSKLDIYTPSVLHPELPPLATGDYTVMGGTANSTYSSNRNFKGATD